MARYSKKYINPPCDKYFMTKHEYKDHKGVMQSYMRTMQHDDFKVAFGLDRKAKWPKHGILAQWVNGVVTWVEPQKAHFAIRVMCLCPVCNATVTASRLNQHARTHFPAID